MGEALVNDTIMSDSLSISDLNNDCLLHIFKFISYPERLNLELVCLRWQEVCSFLWKTTVLFDVTDEKLGYQFKAPKKFGESPSGDVNVPLCKQILPKCFNYLTRVNLSRVRTFQSLTVMSTCLYCIIRFNSKPQGILNDLVVQLSNCVNIKELCLCPCIIDVSDGCLGQLFQNIKQLQSLTLCKYNNIGKCFTHMPLDTIESVHLQDCLIDVQYLNSVVTKACRLHSLSVQWCSDCTLGNVQFKISPVLPLNMLRLNLERHSCSLHISEICKLQNLTILNLKESNVNDHLLKLITQNCKNLVVLLVGENRNLSDSSFHSFNVLSKLKHLDISYNHSLTSGGLEILNKNLQVLDVSATNFSANALLLLVERMQCLEQLSVRDCRQLKTSFVKSVINIVSQRSNKIPLEIEVLDSSIDIKEVKDTRPLVKVEEILESNYIQYY